MKKYKLLTKPLTRQQIGKKKWISGVVHIDVTEIIDHDLESFLDILSGRLIGNALLMETDYQVVGHFKNELHVRVSGDPSLCIE